MLKKADYPEHPGQLVVKPNEYFSNGIKEKNVWFYYEGMKSKLLPALLKKDLFVVMAIKPGNELYVRHPYDKKTKYIRINSLEDFEQYHTGKTAEYHITSPKITDEVVFDIDPGKEIDFDKIKNATYECIEFIKKQKDFSSKIEIRYTGKRGFHVSGFLKEKKDISSIKKDVEERLNAAFKEHNLIIVAINKPPKDKINIDLSPMKTDGGHIAPYSLRIETGLCCVPISSLKSFKKEDAKLDKVFNKNTNKKFVWDNNKKSNYLIILEEINKNGGLL